jgi:hypothetical protein
MKRSSFLTNCILRGFRKLTFGYFPVGQKHLSNSREPGQGLIAPKGMEEFSGFEISLSSTPPFLCGRLPRLGNELE